MQVDLSLLPPPEVIETLNFETILANHVAELINRYPEIIDTIELESEPTRKLLEVSAYRELQLRARYNDEARALLLAYATDADLDHIGATYYQESRLTITAANPSTTPPTSAVLETNNDYRYRLSLKPESYSVAGPRDAFKYHALSADGQVKDASVSSPVRGTTQVYVLSRTSSGVPAAGLLTTVSTALNSETIRPLSEDLIVSPASVVNYALDIDLIMFQGAAAEIALAAAQTAIATYTADNHRLGRDIIRSAIDAAAHQPGVKKVIINSPAADVVCNDAQAAWCTGIAVRVAGVES